MGAHVFKLLSGDRTPLFLAPQAGVSESPFRRLCRRFGADVVVSEFVSADGIVRNPERSHEYLRFDEAERPIGVQIFGADPVMMADAAAYVDEVYGPDFLDINFGCPVKKVVKRNGGSGCLRDLELVESIIRAVNGATDLPVTVKIRSGFDEDTRDPVGIGLLCQEAGARAICLHARTREEMYSGEARWEEIAGLVDSLEIPVIGNGDIKTGADAKRMLDQTGCAGIMIARGSHGDPWIFKQARAALDGLPGPIVLLAGGQAKGADLSPLGAALRGKGRAAILFGEDAGLIEAALGDSVPVQRVSSMAEAVAAARRSACAGDVVLLSPACASLDMFRNYADRGDQFTAAVREGQS